MAHFSPLQGIDIIFLPGLEFLNERECYLLDNSIQILVCADTICLYGEIIIIAHSPIDLSILTMYVHFKELVHSFMQLTVFYLFVHIRYIYYFRVFSIWTSV